MKYLFLDTSILLHYQSFEDIPWKTFLGITEDVTIVVCETVVAEVDKHKDSSRSRLRDRAKKVSSRISDLLLDEITGKLPVRFCPFVKPTSEEENCLSFSVFSVFSVVKYQSISMSIFYLTFLLSVLLIVAGFFCPPIGVIDGSVLTAVGLLLMFSVVEKLPQAIKEGRSIKFQKGDLEVEVSGEQH